MLDCRSVDLDGAMENELPLLELIACFGRKVSPICLTVIGSRS
jgi:hypothetical protein